MNSYNYLIIGSGMTADAAVRGIRTLDADGSIGMFGSESDPPYNRPPLSKGLWKGKPLDSVWRQTPYYTERERAALAFTEAVTLIADKHVPDDVYEQARQQFNDEELVKLMIGIVIINAWNRFAITFGDQPGSYQPDHFVTQPASAAVLTTGH